MGWLFFLVFMDVYVHLFDSSFVCMNSADPSFEYEDDFESSSADEGDGMSTQG